MWANIYALPLVHLICDVFLYPDDLYPSSLGLDNPNHDGPDPCKKVMNLRCDVRDYAELTYSSI